MNWRTVTEKPITLTLAQFDILGQGILSDIKSQCNVWSLYWPGDSAYSLKRARIEIKLNPKVIEISKTLSALLSDDGETGLPYSGRCHGSSTSQKTINIWDRASEALSINHYHTLQQERFMIEQIKTIFASKKGHVHMKVLFDLEKNF